MKTIGAQIRAEIKKKGLEGKLGTIHYYWSRKKELLKAKGIEWRSPAELNRNTCYD